MRYFLLSAEKNYQSLIWRMHRGADEILQKEFHAAFQSRASECKADFWLFLFFRYLPMMGRKVNLFWPITLVEKSVAYNNILQTGFKLVLTVRILQTLGFQPCYVFILDSLQAQWITVYGRRILNKMLHPSLQILPVEITTNVFVVCVQSNWVLSLYVMNIFSFTLSQISFYCIFCPLSLDWVGTTLQKRKKMQFLATSPTPALFLHEMAIIGSLTHLRDLCLHTAKKSTSEA